MGFSGAFWKKVFLGSSLKWNANVPDRCVKPQRKITVEPSCESCTTSSTIFGFEKTLNFALYFFPCGAGPLLQQYSPLRSEQTVSTRLRDSEVGRLPVVKVQTAACTITVLFRQELVMSTSPASPCLNPLFLQNTSTNAPII